MRWDVETGKKTKLSRFGPTAAAVPGGAQSTKPKPRWKGHDNEILCLASSADGRLLVSGGRDSFVRVWDTRTNTVVRNFSGHRDAVLSLAFKKNSKTVRGCGGGTLPVCL